MFDVKNKNIFLNKLLLIIILTRFKNNLNIFEYNIQYLFPVRLTAPFCFGFFSVRSYIYMLYSHKNSLKTTHTLYVHTILAQHYWF